MPPYKTAGYVEDAASFATLIRDRELPHDCPPHDVLASVVHWLQKGGYDTLDTLDVFRFVELEGTTFCRNDGCEIVGLLKDFKVCPQCRTARYRRRRVSETRLECGWAQGKVWHSGKLRSPLPQ